MDDIKQPVQTIHIQTGPFVYLFITDKIVPNDDKLLQYCIDNNLLGPEVTGFAQGEGIETVWWDTTNQALDYDSTPEMLQQRAALVRSLPGVPQPKVEQARFDGSHKSYPKSRRVVRLTTKKD